MKVLTSAVAIVGVTVPSPAFGTNDCRSLPHDMQQAAMATATAASGSDRIEQAIVPVGGLIDAALAEPHFVEIDSERYVQVILFDERVGGGLTLLPLKAYVYHGLEARNRQA